MRKEHHKNGQRRKSVLRLAGDAVLTGTHSLPVEVRPHRPVRQRRTVARPHLEKIGGMDPKVREFIDKYLNTGDRKNISVLRTSIPDTIPGISRQLKGIVNLKRMNDIRDLNLLLAAANRRLEDGGVIVTCAETKYFRKQRILKKYPLGLNYCLLTGDYLLKRVLPKLPVSSRICRTLFGAGDRAMSRTEAMGRLYAAGFEVLEYRFIGGILYLAARKVKPPLFDKERKYGIIFRLRRQGKDGKTIHVYKVRTMHSYSEFIQQYVYEQNNLSDGGKLRNDFRVSTLGRIARKYWLDELPMILNFLTGDLKLVGVRPLSQQYLSLYSEELKALRSRHKPGLVPPFYADMPSTIEEIQASELRYLRAHERSPFLTDVRYFFKAAWNIVVRSARSK
jgi:lipopolysaccharide/colanic/teichoic acid biosynthesis glycosyltransferase